MRRFSQRGHLVTLNEINITPLLDLAFVLLIIFIITTPLMNQGITLPQGGQKDPPIQRSDFLTVELLARGQYELEGEEMGYDALSQRLAVAKQANPAMIIFIRADRAAPFDDVFQVADLCARLGLNLSLRSEPRSELR
ncbi:MAG: ExbD/TolR family protein [Limisphaerales bacterium]|jgi:biopolymer transport protein ExbD